MDSQDLMPRSNQDIKLALSPKKLKFEQIKVLLHQNLHSQFNRQWQMMILMIIFVFLDNLTEYLLFDKTQNFTYQYIYMFCAISIVVMHIEDYQS
jgi:hypothetical protein